MKISFVMPVYNGETYIEEALRSIMRQTYGKFDVIVVDDQSTDHTPEILAEISREDNRVRIARGITRGGCAYIPRKTAIELATGNYVAPLDADDWISDAYLEKLVDRVKTTEADIIYPEMHTDDGSGYHKKLPTSKVDETRVYNGRDLIKQTLDGWNINCNGGLIRKDLYLTCFDKYDNDAHNTYADELLTRQLLLEARHVAFADAKYFYRANPASVTHAPKIGLFDMCENDLRLVHLIEESFPAGSNEHILVARQTFHHYFDAQSIYSKVASRLTETDRKDAIVKMQEMRRNIEWNFLRNHVSPKYYALGKCGGRITRTALKLFGK